MNRQLQTEEITFHPFPEYKPKKKGVYIIQNNDGEVTIAYWSENKRRFSGIKWHQNVKQVSVYWNVVRWTSLPKGYSQRTQSAGHKED